MIRQPTIRQVAVLAGVSPSTVSRVLNGNDGQHMRPATRDRVLAAIHELDYTPQRAARSLRRQRSQVLAILLPDISNPFFALLARGVEAVAFDAGCSTLICDSDNLVPKETRYLSLLLAERVQGVVLVPVAQPDRAAIDRLARCGVRVVVADREVHGLPTISADNRAGSRMLTEHLLELGYRQIAYIAGPSDVSTANDRLAGFLDALRARNMSPVCVRHSPYTYESAYATAKAILARSVLDAIVAANDLMAVGVMRAAEELGRAVPDDLGVAGFDHVPWAAFVRPRLTTVEVPARHMGTEAARMLLEGSVESLLLPVRIIPGETCSRRSMR
ncbi:MAG: LacI family DNA-binding transcriptional regulator [Candidatus Bipolaricaulota bacterium]